MFFINNTAFLTQELCTPPLVPVEKSIHNLIFQYFLRQVGADDFVLSARAFCPDYKPTPTLSVPLEVVLSKQTTVGDLRQLLRSTLQTQLGLESPLTAPVNGVESTNGPEVNAETLTSDATVTAKNEGNGYGSKSDGNGDHGDDGNDDNNSEDVLQFAKAFASGPPLKASGCNALKWEDSAQWSNPNAILSRPPLNFRDGSVVIVRTARAAAAAAAASSSEAMNQPGDKNSKVSSSATRRRAGLSAARGWASNGGGNSSGSFKGGSSRREQGLSIAVAQPAGFNGNNSNAANNAMGGKGGESSGNGTAATTTEIAAIAVDRKAPGGAPSPRSKLAESLKVPLESAGIALEAAGGDEALARSFLLSEM